MSRGAPQHLRQIQQQQQNASFRSIFFVCACSRTEIKNFKCRIGTENLNIALGDSVRGFLTEVLQPGTSIWFLNLVPGTLVLWYLSGKAPTKICSSRNPVRFESEIVYV